MWQVGNLSGWEMVPNQELSLPGCSFERADIIIKPAIYFEEGG
jgi:hypothetical protein